MKIYKKLNAAYKLWKSFPNDIHMNNLITFVRESVVIRYAKTEQDYDDLAQLTSIRVWRALIGDLAPYNEQRGDFAVYVAQQAISVRKDFHKRDRLVPVSENLLEEMQLDGILNKGISKWKGQDPVEFEQGTK